MTTPRIASPGLRVITATAYLCPRLAGTYNYRPAISPGGGAPVLSGGGRVIAGGSRAEGQGDLHRGARATRAAQRDPPTECLDPVFQAPPTAAAGQPTIEYRRIRG